MSCLPRIAAIDAWLLDGTVKGYPGTAAPCLLGDLPARGWNVLRDDVPLPAAVIKASSLEHNRDWMRRFLASSGTKLCPHGKTTMSPQLFAAQLADGAFGITCATVSQLQVYRQFGVGCVVMANQVIGGRAIAYVLDELARDPAFQLYLLVDSVTGVERLARAAATAGASRSLCLLIEVGAAGARTGVRSMPAFEGVLRAIEAAQPWVTVHGVEAFEGVMDPASPDPERAIEALFDFQVEASRVARRSPAAVGSVPWILSGGGSAFFDVAATRLRPGASEAGSIVLLRSGCYLTHDHTSYANAQRARAARSDAVAALGEGFRPALEVWAHVQSRPEPGRVYLTAGKRDVSYDLDLPRPVAWLRPGMHSTPEPLADSHRVVALNDQHAHVALPADSPLAIGDLVGLGISHPCTTFDKWQLLYLVDDDYNVIDAIRTFF